MKKRIKTATGYSLNINLTVVAGSFIAKVIACTPIARIGASFDEHKSFFADATTVAKALCDCS